MTARRRTFDAAVPRLAERITTRRSVSGIGGGRRIRIEPGELDLDVFDDLVRRAENRRRASDLAGAAVLLSEAVRLWRGDFCLGIAETQTATARLLALRERYLDYHPPAATEILTNGLVVHALRSDRAAGRR